MSTRGDDGRRFVLEMTAEQAEAAIVALDALNRLALGQFGIVAELASLGTILPRAEVSPDGDAGRRREVVEDLAEAMEGAKRIFGHDRSSSYGVGSPRTGIVGKRAYEMLKALQRAVAMDRDPTPSFRDVRYDGVTVRYTPDPEPTARVAAAGLDPLSAWRMLEGTMDALGRTPASDPDRPHRVALARHLADTAGAGGFGLEGLPALLDRLRTKREEPHA